MWTAADLRKEQAHRWRANRKPFRWWAPDQLRPVALASLGRHEQAMMLFFEGLRLHWFDAMVSGKREIWAECTSKCGQLLVSAPDAPFVHRAQL